jgi:hypothetical protein
MIEPPTISQEMHSRIMAMTRETAGVALDLLDAHRLDTTVSNVDLAYLIINALAEHDMAVEREPTVT